MTTVLIATANGVLGGGTTPALEGRSVTSLGRADDDVIAIVEHRELWRRTSDTETWDHVADLDELRATCVVSIDGSVFVGTSEAHLFGIEGDALRRIDAFDHVHGRDGWYTPWGGPPDTRSIANWDDDVYVNVHVGGIPRTTDRGATWTPTIDVDADVHQVTTAEGFVLAACAEGLASSRDRGATWSFRTDGLEATYCRAVAVCGDDVFVSSSDGPRGGHAAVYRAPLASGAFDRVDAGPGWFAGNIDSYCLDALPDGSLVAFGTADGHVYVSTDGGSTWDERANDLPQINRVLVMP